MNGAEVVAHVAELARFVEVWVPGIVDGVGRPYPDVAICSDLVNVEVPHRS